VHEEKHEREFARQGGVFEMVQLWVNLPKSKKMSQPCYQEIEKERIPAVSLGKSGYARVIAGEFRGVKGPANTFSPITLLDVRLEAGDQAELVLPGGHNSAIVLLHGNVILNGSEGGLRGEAQIASLSADGERVSVDAKEAATLLVLSGEPIHEPVFSYGPFVMNTNEEIAQAFEDYRSGRMGNLA
jgi:hypothetical protein